MIERTFIEQGVKKIELENYMKKQLDKAGFTHLNIVKTPLVTRIVLNVARPGLAIGKGGQTIRQLTREIEEKFGINSPQIEIREIINPNLDARATVDRMVALLERGFSWRSVAFRTVRNIMGAGAQGCELVLSGKLTGKGGRKRKQRIAEGYMKKVGDQTSLVDYAKKSAYPKAGAIGIKLRIIKPDTIFPDKVDIKELIDKLKTPKEEKKEVKEETEKSEEKKDDIKAEETAEKKTEEKTEKKNGDTKTKKQEKVKDSGKVKEKKVVSKEKKVKSIKKSKKKEEKKVDKKDEKKEKK